MKVSNINSLHNIKDFFIRNCDKLIDNCVECLICLKYKNKKALPKGRTLSHQTKTYIMGY